MSQHIHFITGRLAEHALRSVVTNLSMEAGFEFTVEVLPITVAALMSPRWIAAHWRPPPTADRIVIPGYCEGDLAPLLESTTARVERGPRDLRQLPAYFLREPPAAHYGAYDIEIIAEINHCPRLTLDKILQTAESLSRDGADVIDVGCDPGDTWTGVAEAVRALSDAGYRVSIDSLNIVEISQAVAAGAELVLSVNSSNREAVVDWGVEVVAIPDVPETLEGLDETLNQLAQNGVAFRIDPILEPISFGFAQSLGRYLKVRRRYPNAEIMMGVGNLTELTDVDSAGVNALLIGFCQELGIRSVLTTQVINWARTSVKECHAARRLMYHAVTHRVLPKHLETGLLMLRDAEIYQPAPEDLNELASRVRDNNYRIFTAGGEVHLVAAGLHLHDADPFVVMEQLRQSGPQGGPPKNLDAGHAFYLGYEMCKAATALTLGKNYVQDEALDWGLATQPERRHYLKRSAADSGDTEAEGLES